MDKDKKIQVIMEQNERLEKMNEEELRRQNMKKRNGKKKWKE